MRKSPIAGAIRAAAVVVLAGVTMSCGGGPDAGAAPDAGQALGVSGETGADDVRALWLAMADDPLHHMMLARELVEEGDPVQAARQLETSAYLFRWGCLYARGSRERRDFVMTAQELEGAARRLRQGEDVEVERLDRTVATGLRAMADHHAAMALEEWQAGEHTRAALLMHATAAEVRAGFSLSGQAPGGTIERALVVAGTVADRLDSRSPPDEREVREAIEGLRNGASGLGDVLGSRRG